MNPTLDSSGIGWHQMSVAEIVAFIESKRVEVNKLLTRASNEMPFKMDAATVLPLLNDRLTRNLSLSFIKGDALVKLHALDDPTDSLVLSDRPMTDEEAFGRMRYLIEEDELGSKNPEIRKVAKDQVEAISRSLQISLPVPPVNELYRRRLSADPEAAEQTVMLARHCAVAAETLYDFVRTRIHYTGEGGENLQRALHTLMVGGGDCDDLAILMGSLIRSLGYSVYLKFLPGHVFAGVVLGRVRGPIAVETLPREIRQDIPGPSEKIYPTEYVMLPLDPGSFRLMDCTFDVFDIFNGEFERIASEAVAKTRSALSGQKEPVQTALQQFTDTELDKVAKQVSELSGESKRFLITDVRIQSDRLTHVKEISELFAQQTSAALRQEGISFRR
jgi:hypothetical protein